MTRKTIPSPGAITPEASRIDGKFLPTRFMTDEGCWAVTVVCDDADSDEIFDLNEAIALARRAAKEYHARVEANDLDAIERADLRPSDDHNGDA
jgi:hypothetical protein